MRHRWPLGDAIFTLFPSGLGMYIPMSLVVGSFAYAFFASSFFTSLTFQAREAFASAALDALTLA